MSNPIITAALKKAGVKRSEVSEYVVKDSHGVSGTYAPRTKSLRNELWLLFKDPDPAYVVDKVWVNALKQVVIEIHYDYS